MTEPEAQAALEARGCAVLHYGWPDFCVRRPDGAIAFVEVKHNGDKISAVQAEMHETLATAGLRTAIVRTPAELDALDFVHAPDSAAPRRQVAALKLERAELKSRLELLEKQLADAERAADAANDDVGRFVAEVYNLIERTIGREFGAELAARVYRSPKTPK